MAYKDQTVIGCMNPPPQDARRKLPPDSITYDVHPMDFDILDSEYHLGEERA